RREFDHESAARAALYLCAVPGAVFFAALYSESLFLALVTATLYHARQGQWARAAVAAAAAAVTRNTGVILAAVLVLEGVHQQDVRFWPLRLRIEQLTASWRSLSAATVVPVGLVGYML